MKGTIVWGYHHQIPKQQPKPPIDVEDGKKIHVLKWLDQKKANPGQ